MSFAVVTYAFSSCIIWHIYTLIYFKHPLFSNKQYIQYTICAVEEVVGTKLGEQTYYHLFQVLVGDLCTSSYTNRGGEDNLGDGSYDTDNVRVGGTSGTLVREYDSKECATKCSDKEKVKYITIGNPPVELPDAYDTSNLITLDISDPSTDIININTDRTHSSSWLLETNVSSNAALTATCNSLPDPAGLSFRDLESLPGHRSKFNLDKPIFAKLPDGNWTLHDFRTLFHENTKTNPLMDGGGSIMDRAASANNDNLVVLCSNVQRNFINEPFCKLSYDEDACVSVPLNGEPQVGVPCYVLSWCSTH